MVSLKSVDKAFDVLMKLEKNNSLAINEQTDLMEARLTLQFALEVLGGLKVEPL